MILKNRAFLLKLSLTIFVLALISISAYAFTSGPLFPYSPIKPGFAKLESEKAIIYYPNGTNPPEECLGIDSLVEETESFHRLGFDKKPKIIFCETSKQYERFSTRTAHACAIQTGDAIYINPSIYSSNRDLNGFFKHELSHAVIYQNTSIFSALRLKGWFTEGMAVYYGNSHHYYRGNELKELAIDEGYFFDIFDDKARPADMPKTIRYSYFYGLYGSFIGYLADCYGSSAVMDFTAEYIKYPKKEGEIFTRIFGLSQEKVLQEFKNKMANEGLS